MKLRENLCKPRVRRSVNLNRRLTDPVGSTDRSSRINLIVSDRRHAPPPSSCFWSLRLCGNRVAKHSERTPHSLTMSASRTQLPSLFYEIPEVDIYSRT